MVHEPCKMTNLVTNYERFPDMCLTPSLIAALVFAILPQAARAAETYRVDPDHTFVHFSVVHTGISSLRGRIGTGKGQATLDAGEEKAEVDVPIDMRTLETGIKRLDAVLSGKLFFDVERFQTARFKGRAMRFADGMPVQFDGELTIKNVTRPVQLAAERFVCKDVEIFTLKRHVCGGDLATTVKRSDFGLSKYLDMVSDEVRILISVEAIRDGP
jgi:polyisoprenoid-binding protein YceI